MPIATLEEIRLLSNLETDRHKLLQIVLFGQPELDENLRQTNIRQLRERITHSFYLSPLSAQEIGAYLAFRLHAAGYRGPALFSKRVIAYMAKASCGLTRRVNIIADKAMLAAFAESTHNITLKHVRNAVQDSEFSRSLRTGARRFWLGWALASVGAGLAAACAWWLLTPATLDRSFTSQRTTSPAPVAPAADPLPPAPAQPPAPVADANQAPAPPAVAANAASVPEPPREPLSAPALRIASEISQPEPPKAAEPVAVEMAHQSLPEDFLERRLQATESWLSTQGERTYTIQLMGSADAEYLKQYFKSLAKSIETENIFVYRTIANMKPSLTVVYGAYPTVRAVNEAIEHLPPELLRYRPYQRTIRGIRAEIEAARLSTTSR
jgi:septal ring-binding cell division protein DamX